MVTTENLKRAIQVFEESIKTLKKCNTIEETRLELYVKIKTLLKEVSWLGEFVDSLRIDTLRTDSQVESIRDAILSEFPKQIEMCKNSIKKIKSQQFKIFKLPKIPKKAIIIISIVIIGLLLFIFVPRPPPVLEVKVSPGSPLYSYQWSDRQWMGNSVNYTIEVKNNGNEDLQNVSVTDSAGFDWTGTLKADESRNFVIIYLGQLEEQLVISANVQGSNSEGVLFSHSDETTVEIFGGTYDLEFATDEGLITWEIRGNGACSGYSIEFSAKLKVNLPIGIKLGTPMILNNLGTGQNMIICDQRTLNLTPDIDYDFEIKAYCLDLHKSNPSSSENFIILGDSDEYGEDVITLINYINSMESGPEVTSIQIAVWVLTDNIERDWIPFSYYERHITQAKGLLEGAGIDISGYIIFQ